ncbi:hypothetical protein ABH976_002508 [Bradyrhizobium ottawaense]
MRANDLIRMMRHRRQGDDGAGRGEVRNVERNASGVLHRLDRPKRIDVGKADQLKSGGRSEGVEQHGLAGC